AMERSGGNELERATHEHVVQRPAAIAGEVERHVAKAVPLSRFDDALADFGLYEASQLGDIDFDAGDGVVPAHPDLAKAERFEVGFERTDLGEALAGDARSVRNAARQARGCGFVPNVEPDEARGSADVGLAHFGFHEGTADERLLGRAQP